MSQRAIIIGAGLGGLQCACILARNGYDVTVLEQGIQAGGCLQSFKRSGALFDTGFHYVGGLGEGEVLEWLFRYYNLLDLPWKKLDEDCTDRIIIDGQTFKLASGYDRFIESLAAQFPGEKDGLVRYISQLKEIGDGISRNFGTGTQMELFGKSAYGFLCDCISDPLLRKVLSGSSLRLEYSETLPLYVFAQINNSFIQSGWRLLGGGQTLVKALVSEVTKAGGKVLTNAMVDRIEEKDGKATAAVTADGRVFSGDVFISDTHPSVTLDLLRDSAVIKNIYRRRIKSLRNSYGVFTLNAKIREGALPYENFNTYIHGADADVWHSQGESMMISYGVPETGDTATTIDLLTRMDWNDVYEFAGTKPMRRGPEYESFKEKMAEECIRRAEAVIPNLKDSIDFHHTSTSLTYNSYTGTYNGSAFGIMKDWNSPLTTVLSPRTPVENLLMTGQNLNLHGILGVSMTSLYTCAQLLGLEKIRKDFNIQ